jgi:hypothetical protein
VTADYLKRVSADLRARRGVEALEPETETHVARFELGRRELHVLTFESAQHGRSIVLRIFAPEIPGKTYRRRESAFLRSTEELDGLVEALRSVRATLEGPTPPPGAPPAAPRGDADE